MRGESMDDSLKFKIFKNDPLGSFQRKNLVFWGAQTDFVWLYTEQASFNVELDVPYNNASPPRKTTICKFF